MTASHASEELIARYVGGDPDIAGDRLWALEAHLETCATCRAGVARAVGERAPELTALVGEVWSAVAERSAASAPARRRRWARWSAAWVAPALPPWILMTILVTLIGVLFDLVAVRQRGGVSLVLLAAPVLPVLGVAASWGRGVDPAYEVTIATPRAGTHLVFRRTLAVLVVVLPVLTAAGWAIGMAPALWLLPCLAFTVGTLALARLVGMFRAVTALIGVWAAVIVTPTVLLSRTSFALEPAAMPVWGAIFALGLAAVAARRADHFLPASRR